MSQDLPVPQNDAINETLRRKHLAALAESTLKFRRTACDTMDELIVEMIGQQCEIGFNKFRTPNGRNCILILGIGDDAVGSLTDAVYYLTHPEEGKHDQGKDPRE